MRCCRAQVLLANDRGSWLVSGRRGFLDLAGRAIGTENPALWDLLGKLELRLGESQLLWNTGSRDGETISISKRASEATFKRLQNDYDDRYAWLRHQGILGELAAGRVRPFVDSDHSRSQWNRDRREGELRRRGRAPNRHRGAVADLEPGAERDAPPALGRAAARLRRGLRLPQSDRAQRSSSKARGRRHATRRTFSWRPAKPPH